MAIVPIDPSLVVSGGEWAVTSPATPAPAAGTGSDFGGMLADQIGALERLQTDAAKSARELAAGTAEDPTAAIMAVERARLGMDLASTIRTKSVEALQEIFHTQV